MLLSHTRKKRFYEIEAIEIPIVYNKYGDHDPNGLLYVLKKDAERVLTCAMKNFSQDIPQPCDEVKPLVIRANKGDTVVVTFTHSLNRPLSIHVQGMAYDVQTSDGASVGYNKDSTTFHRITYTWYAKHEGVYIFHDMGDPTSNEDSTNIHGLFGAIIVEAPQSRWLDPENGKELDSGLFADIYHPTHPAFREYAVFFHDELEITWSQSETTSHCPCFHNKKPRLHHKLQWQQTNTLSSSEILILLSLSHSHVSPAQEYTVRKCKSTKEVLLLTISPVS